MSGVPVSILGVLNALRGVLNGDASQDADRVYEASLRATDEVEELVLAARNIRDEMRLILFGYSLGAERSNAANEAIRRLNRALTRADGRQP